MDLRRRRSDRLFRRHRQRCRLRGRRQRRSARARPRLGQAEMEIHDRQPDWRVVTGGQQLSGLHRRSRRPGARGQHRRRHAAVDLQNRFRGEVIAGCRRRCSAHRLVRRQPLRVRTDDRQTQMEGDDQWDGARHTGGPERTGLHRRVRLDPARDPHSGWQRGVSHRFRRLHRRIAAHRRHARLLRDVQQRGARIRSAEPTTVVALCRSRAAISFLFLGGAQQWTHHPRRAGQVGPRH